jgi:hypothetical protein
MNEARGNATRALTGLTAPPVGGDLPRAAEFSEAEWRRLLFLRWLCRTGRLTEWA